MDARQRILASVAFALLCAVTPAQALPADTQTRSVDAGGYPVPLEGFMRLTGTVAFDADRRVSAYALDRAADVPEEVRTFLARQVADWRIEFDPGVVPPDGPLQFTVRVRASPEGDGLYRLWLDGRDLTDVLPAAQRLRAKRMWPPDYPRGMLRIGASGIAYTQVLLDRSGTVLDLFTDQVDLTAVPADPADIPRYQREFAASAAAGGGRGRFLVPEEGPYARDRLVVRIPIGFDIRGRTVPYGQWEYLIRGVRGTSPWQAAGGEPEVAASAGVQPLRPRLRLVSAASGLEG